MNTTVHPCNTRHKAIGVFKDVAPRGRQRDEAVKAVTLINRAATALNHFDEAKIQQVITSVQSLLNLEVMLPQVRGVDVEAGDFWYLDCQSRW